MLSVRGSVWGRPRSFGAEGVSEVLHLLKKAEVLRRCKTPGAPTAEVRLTAAGMGVIEEVGASVRAVLARFTQGMKQGQRVVGAPWPSAEGEGAQRPGLKHAAGSSANELLTCL